jgi:hypothetical protein
MLEPAMLKKLSGKGGLEGLRPSKSLILVVAAAVPPVPPNKNVCRGRHGPHTPSRRFSDILAIEHRTQLADAAAKLARSPAGKLLLQFRAH